MVLESVVSGVLNRFLSAYVSLLSPPIFLFPTFPPPSLRLLTILVRWRTGRQPQRRSTQARNLVGRCEAQEPAIEEGSSRQVSFTGGRGGRIFGGVDSEHSLVRFLSSFRAVFERGFDFAAIFFLLPPSKAPQLHSVRADGSLAEHQTD
jgi:hypothetical protein